jgi:hypothetical protein
VCKTKETTWPAVLGMTSVFRVKVWIAFCGRVIFNGALQNEVNLLTSR